MYFEVVNSPENVRRRRGNENQDEVTPRLILAPFTAAPKVVFDNVPIGRMANQLLDICNPGKRLLMISLIKEPNSDLGFNIPLREFHIQPGETVQLCLGWRPITTINIRETLHFQDDCRGKYEVILIFKSVAMSVRKPAKAGMKYTPSKVLSKKIVKRRSPSKPVSPPTRITSKVIQNKFEQSRVSMNNSDYYLDFRTGSRKAECKSANSFSSRLTEENYRPNCSLEEGDPTCSLTGRATFVVQDQNKYGSISTPPKSILNAIENLEFTPLRCKTDKRMKNNYSVGRPNASTRTSNMYEYCEYPNESIDCPNYYETYDAYLNENSGPENNKHPQYCIRKNSALKETNLKHPRVESNLETSGLNNLQHANNTHPIIDLENIDSYIASVSNSPDCKSNTGKKVIDLTTPDQCDSFNIDVRVPLKHGISSVSICSPRDKFDKWVEAELYQEKDSLRSISIVINNMGFSQLNDSEIVFDPHRCSTERKEPQKSCSNSTTPTICKGLFKDDSVSKINSRKQSIERADSPIIPLDPNNPYNLQSSPYGNENNLNKLSFDEINAQKQSHSISNLIDGCNKNFDHKQSGRKRSVLDRNCADNVKNVIEANLWQRSPTSTSPLPLIPEESCLLSETQCLDKKMETFTFNRTYDLPPTNGTFNISSRSQKNNVSYNHKSQIWSKSSNKPDGVVWKLPVLPNIEKLRDINPDHLIMNAYSTATTLDPFLSTSYFYDEELVDKFAKEFKRWLNFLLTPPAELDAAADGPRVDVGKVWIESRNKEVPEAPTKEQVSSKYHTSHRLDSLRKSARNLLMSEHTMSVFVKVSAQIDKKILSIRQDKNLHLDIGLQKIIMDLLLCYNPLWLRMGLEAIYGTVIPLTSNNDILGLSTFIIQRMFKDPYMKSKQAQPTLPNMITPQYTEYMKKFTLKKFFMLVYFLDQAKQKKIICHDPCLFCRTAPYKESREMLIRFTRELITGVGDITKHLRPCGYVVTHKQSDLDEFKYAVQNLAIDLKDGVRLTRLMEIILVKEGLTNRLRVPAISRLQKIHNVKIALTALNEAGFDITGEITPKDISDGHREKTLSLLWQIIHRFRAPLFEKAATTIQLWWRKKYLTVWIRNRIRKRKLEILSNAAVKIQAYWRMFLCLRKYIQLKKATLTIQLFYKRSFVRTQFIKKKNACTLIQQWYRAIRLMEVERSYFLKLKMSCIYIQRKYRYLKYGILCRRKYMQLTNATIAIQQFYRSILLMRFDRAQFLRKKVACIHIQQRYRATILMKSQRIYYEKLKTSSINIQRRYRSLRSGIQCRQNYTQLKKATLTIQQFYRSILLMRFDRAQFLRKKVACIHIQQRYRATILMKSQKIYYEKLKTSSINIQRRYRSLKSGIQCRQNYTQLKKATLTIQQFYRSILLMRFDRAQFLKKKVACIHIQQWYRATILMKSQKIYYEKLKTSSINIQRRYRSLKSGIQCRQNYTQLKKATLTIQQFYRSILLMRFDRAQFLRKKVACIHIQQRYRATILMKSQKIYYEKLKTSSINIQRRYRSLKSGIQCRQNYTQLKKATLTIQQFYRSILLMRFDRAQFLRKKVACIHIQHRYRATILMKSQKIYYEKLKTSSINIQRRYRSLKSGIQCRQNYIQLKKATLTIQQFYRSILLMRFDRAQFLRNKVACIHIQQWYRATRLMKAKRLNFKQLLKACINTQRRYRSLKIMRKVRVNYCEMKYSAVKIQQWFRAILQMIPQKKTFNKLKIASIFVQRKYRAKHLMILAQSQYMKKKRAAFVIQRWFRSLKEMFKCREKYTVARKSVISIQTWYRSILKMRKDRSYYRSLRFNAIKIQCLYKGKVLTKRHREKYLYEKKCVIVIQSIARCFIARKQYLRLRNAATAVQVTYRQKKAVETARLKRKQIISTIIAIQAHTRGKLTRIRYREKINAIIKIKCFWKSVLAMRRERKAYQDLRRNVVLIQCLARGYLVRTYLAKLKEEERQRHQEMCNKAALTIQGMYRANKLMISARSQYSRKKQATVAIQQWFRAIREMFKCREKYICMRESAISIQTWYRSILYMRKERSYYCRLRFNVVKMQRLYRYKVIAKLHRETYLYIRSSIIKIQAAMRCFVARRKYLRLRHAAITVQAIYKQKKAIECARMKRKLMFFAIIKVQSFFKGVLARRMFREKINAILRIQHFWKSILKMKRDRKSFLDLRQKIVLIQSLARGYLVRSRLEKLKELMVKKKQEEIVHKAALQIQTLWRGYKVRQEYLDDRVINLRKRWQEGALKSQQETLAERNEDALEVLQHFSDMASVIRAFLSLDLLTRVYPMMYDKDSMGSVVCEKLILYMSATNRSISSLETLRLSVSILLNLTKYKPMYVYSKCHVNIILTLMMRWCDKDSQFFRFLCTLIWLFGSYDHFHKELCEDLAKGDNNKMLKRIRSLIQRKSRMEERTRSRNNILNLKNSIFSVSLNSSRLNRTMCNSNILALPSSKPDYGIQQPNKPRVFQSDIQAIDHLFFKFNLSF